MNPFGERPHHRTHRTTHTQGPVVTPPAPAPTLTIATVYRLSREEARYVEDDGIDLHELLHAHLDETRAWRTVDIPVREDAGLPVPVVLAFGRAASPTRLQRAAVGALCGLGLGLWLSVLYLIGGRLW